MESGTEKCRFLNDHFYWCLDYYGENQMKEGENNGNTWFNKDL